MLCSVYAEGLVVYVAPLLYVYERARDFSYISSASFRSAGCFSFLFCCCCRFFFREREKCYYIAYYEIVFVKLMCHGTSMCVIGYEYMRLDLHNIEHFFSPTLSLAYFSCDLSKSAIVSFESCCWLCLVPLLKIK